MNGYQQEGFGRMDMTIHQGRRWSAATAYLLPALTRPNLTVRTNTLVSRVLLEGNRAVGVAVIDSRKGDEETLIHCSDEVILSGGAVNSPQVRMR